MSSIILGSIFIVISVYLACKEGFLPSIENYSMRLVSGALFILGLILLFRELG